jgi:hypothetical protein
MELTDMNLLLDFANCNTYNTFINVFSRFNNPFYG